MILEKNNLQTVQELNEPYVELLNSLTCTPKAPKYNFMLERPVIRYDCPRRQPIYML